MGRDVHPTSVDPTHASVYLALFALALGASACLSPSGAIQLKRAGATQLQKNCLTAGGQAEVGSVSAARAQVTLTATQAETLCQSAASYSCSHKIFSPDATDGRAMASECFDHDMLGRICMEVDTLTYSTKAAALSSGTDPKASQPGGEYNYEEYRCLNRTANQGSTTNPVLSEATSLKQALTLAMGKCLALGRTP